MMATWIDRSLAPYRKYAVFSGRSDVAEYIGFCALQVLAFLAVVVAAPGEVATPQDSQGPPPYWFVAYALFWLASVLPWFALVSRRFHDQGRSGKLAWLALAPWVALGFGPPALAILLWIGLLLWLVMPGQRGENAYGPPQLENAKGEAVSGRSEADLTALSRTRVAQESKVLGREFGDNMQVQRAQGQVGLKQRREVSSKSANASADVQLGGDGRYHARGYSFVTLQQAEAFVAREHRRQSPISHRPSPISAAQHSPVRSAATLPARSPAAPFTQAPTPTQESAAGMPGIQLGSDSRYHVNGYSFATSAQAEAYLARVRNPGLPPGTRRLSIDDTGRPLALEPHESAGTSERQVPQPQTSREPKKERWIQEPETVEIGDHHLTLELTYFGKAKDRYAWPSHNSLIDPALPVAREGTSEELGYWPNYGQMSPRQRRNYIDWLATGRRDPTTSIGYVFVYFYGLERRLTLDHSRDAAEPILAELRALHVIYGTNHSFDRYATKLIEFAEYQTGSGSFELTPEVARSLHNGYELPLQVRVALGQALSAGGKLDADQALCWALAAPGSYLRTPGTRCFDQLCELWRIRFAQSQPEGLKVRLGKRHIEGQYRPASGGYTAEISFPDLPDVASFSTDRLQRMLDDCTTALDPYSRFLGRNPALTNTVQAVALLPIELRGIAGGALTDARDKLVQIVGQNTAERGGSTFSAVRTILALPSLPAGEKVAARDMKDMADVLDAMDFGFEPDRRFGKVGPLLPETPVALFSAPGGGHVDSEGPAYSAARVMAEISALAAISDGVAVDEELRSVARDLAQFGLSSIETSRLLALVHAILIDPPHSRAAMRRALELPTAERTRIADAAIGAVLADGKVLPAEVRFLEALHKTLGLNPEGVYSRLHRGAVEEELASVAPAVLRPGAAIPEEERKKAAVAIDEKRLARIKQETSAVSVLLSEIFEDEDTPPAPAPPTVWKDENGYRGLDSAHSQLLDALLQGPMPRAAFDEIARELKLMPAGAIETINDWAFEQFGEAVLDDDDPVAIIEYLQNNIVGIRGQS